MFKLMTPSNTTPVQYKLYRYLRITPKIFLKVMLIQFKISFKFTINDNH